jgi:hypothetical protein
MDMSLKSLEEALLIRRQIGTLKKRLASLLGTALSRSAFKAGGGVGGANFMAIIGIIKNKMAKK